MQILLDNKKVMIEKMNYETLGSILDEVTKILGRNNRMLFEVMVNGRAIDDNDIVLSKNIDILEVYSKSVRGMILEVFNEFKEGLESFFEEVEDLEVEFQKEDGGPFVEGFVLLLRKTEWIYEFLLSLKDNTALDYKYSSFIENLDKLGDSFELLDSYQEKLDFKEMFTLVSGEIRDSLKEIGERIDIYFQEIQKEEHETRYCS